MSSNFKIEFWNISFLLIWFYCEKSTHFHVYMHFHKQILNLSYVVRVVFFTRIINHILFYIRSRIEYLGSAARLYKIISSANDLLKNRVQGIQAQDERLRVEILKAFFLLWNAVITFIILLPNKNEFLVFREWS